MHRWLLVKVYIVSDLETSKFQTFKIGIYNELASDRGISVVCYNSLAMITRIVVLRPVGEKDSFK